MTVQRVMHSGCFDLGLCSEDESEPSEHKHTRPEACTQAAELVPSDLHCCYVRYKAKSTRANILDCVDKLQRNMREGKNLPLKNQRSSTSFSECETPRGGTTLESGLSSWEERLYMETRLESALHRSFREAPERQKACEGFSSLGDNTSSDRTNDCQNSCISKTSGNPGNCPKLEEIS